MIYESLSADYGLTHQNMIVPMMRRETSPLNVRMSSQVETINTRDNNLSLGDSSAKILNVQNIGETSFLG